MVDEAVPSVQDGVALAAGLEVGGHAVAGEREARGITDLIGAGGRRQPAGKVDLLDGGAEEAEGRETIRRTREGNRAAADCLAGVYMRWVAEGKITPPPVSHYPLERVADAHRALESGRTVGKLVLATA